MNHTFWYNFCIIIAIVYGVAFIPAFKTAIAFWLYKDKDDVACKAMKQGFIIGLLKIWVIYPLFIIKDCLNSLKRR